MEMAVCDKAPLHTVIMVLSNESDFKYVSAFWEQPVIKVSQSEVRSLLMWAAVICTSSIRNAFDDNDDRIF